MKKFLLFLLLLNLVFSVGCSKKDAEVEKKPLVIATTYAIYDIVKHIGAKEVKASMLIPPGREIHSFEPSPKDIIKLNNASLVFYNGEGLEPWIGQFDIGAKGVNLSEFVHLLEVSDEDEEEEHHHHHGTHDPHYWLDFSNMEKVAKVVTQKLTELEPKNGALFQKRLSEYVQMLHNLDKNYATTLKTCKLHTLYVNHNAYSYMAKRYGLSVHSLVGLSPDAQPNPKTVESILKGIKKEGAKALFYEPFENNAVVFSIAKEVGVQPLVLQPLGNVTAKEAQQKLGYKEIMQRNLQNIKIGLECDGV